MPTGYYVPTPLVVAANAAVVAHAADATLDIDSFGKIHTNTGAGGAVNLTLPAAKDAAGVGLKIQVTAAQIVKATPQAGEKIFLGGSGVASKYLQLAGVIGNYLDLFSDGVQYHVLNYSGVATKEA